MVISEHSIVIPAYNESARIESALERVLACVAERTGTPRFSSSTTAPPTTLAAIVQPLDADASPPSPHLERGNRGKGYSVRNGLLQASGQSSCSLMPISPRPWKKPSVSSPPSTRRRRRHRLPLARKQPPDHPPAALPPVLRPLLQLGHPRVMGLPFTDTQCGFKAFTRDAAQTIFQLQTIERWGFDPEILFIARKRGYSIVEVPVTWGHDERSRISYLKDGMKMLEEMVQIRYNSSADATMKPSPRCATPAP